MTQKNRIIKGKNWIKGGGVKNDNWQQLLRTSRRDQVCQLEIQIFQVSLRERTQLMSDFRGGGV